MQNWHFVCENSLSCYVLQCCWGLVPDVLSGSNVFIHSATLPKKKYISLWFFLDSLLAVKMKVLCVFEMSEITTTTTHHSIPGVLSLEQNWGEIPPPQKKKIAIAFCFPCSFIGHVEAGTLWTLYIYLLMYNFTAC